MDRTLLALGAVAAFVFAACGSHGDNPGYGPGPGGGKDGGPPGRDEDSGFVPFDDSGTGSFGDATPPPPGGNDGCGHVISALIRDFKPSTESGGHADFERDD